MALIDADLSAFWFSSQPILSPGCFPVLVTVAGAEIFWVGVAIRKKIQYLLSFHFEANALNFKILSKKLKCMLLNIFMRFYYCRSSPSSTSHFIQKAILLCNALSWRSPTKQIPALLALHVRQELIQNLPGMFQFSTISCSMRKQNRTSWDMDHYGLPAAFIFFWCCSHRIFLGKDVANGYTPLKKECPPNEYAITINFSNPWHFNFKKIFNNFFGNNYYWI